MLELTMAAALMTTGETRRAVHAGRLACPLLGTVDVERCLECSFLRRLEGGRHLGVVCLRSAERTEDGEAW